MSIRYSEWHFKRWFWRSTKISYPYTIYDSYTLEYILMPQNMMVLCWHSPYFHVFRSASFFALYAGTLLYIDEVLTFSFELFRVHEFTMALHNYCHWPWEAVCAVSPHVSELHMGIHWPFSSRNRQRICQISMFLFSRRVSFKKSRHSDVDISNKWKHNKNVCYSNYSAHKWQRITNPLHFMNACGFQTKAPHKNVLIKCS